MRLILARHGQSLGNVDPVTYAGQDSPLTPLGEAQADRLGRWLAAHESAIDLIVCSPLQRARQTAEIANTHLRLPLVFDDRLREIEKFDLPLLRRRLHPFSPETDHVDPASDGYYDRYSLQVRGALDALTADLNRPRPVLVVSHGGTSATILRLVMERHDIYFLSHNTALHLLEWREGRWHISGLNLTPHLPPELIT
jgi:broad specificity phosphatase PhoE